MSSLGELFDDLVGASRRRSSRIESPERLEAELAARFGRVTRAHGHNGLELVVDCPVCGRHKLSVNAVSGIYKCWRGCTSGMVDRLLGAHVPRVETEARHEPERAAEYFPPGELISLRSLPDDSPAVVYLRARGFDVDEMSDVFGMTYCRFGKSFARGRFNVTNTLSVPVSMDGRLIGWQNRMLYDPDTIPDDRCAMLGFKFEDGRWIRPPKYLTMPGMDKRAVLWNFDTARASDVVVLTEGVFDAARVGRCGVAAFGKSVSDVQIGLLQRNWKCVVLLLDPDAAREAERLETRFTCATPVVRVALSGYKDAGEATREAVWRQILAAMDAAGVDPGKFNIVA